MRSLTFFLLTFCLGLWDARAAHAGRDAAFLAPNAVTAGPNAKSDEAITVEPKSDVELGDTAVNVGRRATFFFVNQTNLPVEIESITANGDSNVRAEIVGDDCSKEKQILASSRCSVTIEATPVGAGSWTAELLLTHKSAGRIARARLMGKTSGVTADKRDMGLSLNTKDFKPVDFGDVEVGTGKAVRTALMVNDSNEIITILSIEIIAPENGLQKLEQGCQADMELKMGESCPITMVWKPEVKSNVSTDLIIRHSGRVGFAVIPVRGTAKEIIVKNSDSKGTETKDSASKPSSGKAGTLPTPDSSTKIPMSPTADELEGMLKHSKMPLVPSDLLSEGEGGKPKASASASIDQYHLIGTVGNRAVFYKPDGSTVIVAVGEDIKLDDDKTMRVTNVAAKEAEVFFAGKKRILKLEVASALTQRAVQARQDEPKREIKSGGANGVGGPKVSTSPDMQIVPLPTGRP